MTHVFETILEMSFGAALLALLVIAARSVAGKKPVMLMPVLCAMLILKLVIPISVQSPLSVQNIFSAHTPQTVIEMAQADTIPPRDDTGAAETAAADTTDVAVQNHQTAAAPTQASIPQTAQTAWQPSAMDIAALIWIIGMVVLTACVAVGNIRFVRMLRRNRPYTAPGFDALLSECKRACHIKTRIVVLRASEINTAAVYGIFRPKLLISPGVFETLSTQEKRHVLMHELSHIKSRDTLTCLILTAVNIVHWFNPLVRVVFVLMRRDLEVLCDANVLKNIGDSEKYSYASTLLGLLKMPNAKSQPLVTALFMRKNSIKRRIIMISRYKKRAPLYTMLALVLTIIIAVTGCTTAVQDTQPVTQPDTASVQPDGQTKSTDEDTTAANTGTESVIAMFECDYSAYSDSAELSDNVEKAAALLDGTVIAGDDHIDAPDGLDFMTLFTPITTANGWKTAPGIFWNINSNDWQAAEGIIPADNTYDMHVGGGIDLVLYTLKEAAGMAQLDQITCGGVGSADFEKCSFGISNHSYESDITVHAYATGSSIVVELCGTLPFEQAAEITAVQPALMTSFALDYNTHKAASTFFNIEKAAALLDGAIMAPGQELSLNDILGPRNEATGWKAAAGISDGAFVMQYGGGVSAISNALYNAAIRAELDVVASSPHAIVPDYVPGGLDATISTGGPDLIISNPYTIDVTIKTRFEDGIVTVDVYGPPRDYTVDFTSKLVSTDDTPETVYVYDTETTPDGQPIPEGQSVQYVHARPSKTYAVYKTLYDADGNEIETVKFRQCTYRGYQGILYVNAPDPK